MAARSETERIHVRVLVSFNGMVRGDEGLLEDTPMLRRYELAGFLEVIGGGTDPAGSGESESDVQGAGEA